MLSFKIWDEEQYIVWSAFYTLRVKMNNSLTEMLMHLGRGNRKLAAGGHLT
jgi:hypothetical protein